MDVFPIIAVSLIQHVGGARSHPGLLSFEVGNAERWQIWNVVIKHQNKYNRNGYFSTGTVRVKWLMHHVLKSTQPQCDSIGCARSM